MKNPALNQQLPAVSKAVNALEFVKVSQRKIFDPVIERFGRLFPDRNRIVVGHKQSNYLLTRVAKAGTLH